MTSTAATRHLPAQVLPGNSLLVDEETPVHHHEATTTTANTPSIPRPAVQFLQGNPPPTPTDYEIMTESCDWCLAETPWDDGDLFGTSVDKNDENRVNTSTSSATNQQKTPPQETTQVNLRPRQAFGIPIL